jgi:hypothetical protein
MPARPTTHSWAVRGKRVGHAAISARGHAKNGGADHQSLSTALQTLLDVGSGGMICQIRVLTRPLHRPPVCATAACLKDCLAVLQEPQEEGLQVVQG